MFVLQWIITQKCLTEVYIQSSNDRICCFARYAVVTVLLLKHDAVRLRGFFEGWWCSFVFLHIVAVVVKQEHNLDLLTGTKC